MLTAKCLFKKVLLAQLGFIAFCASAFPTEIGTEEKTGTVLKIHASSLQDAIVFVSKEMNIAIYADFDLLKDKKVPAIEGTYTADEVLALLLDGHPLNFEKSGDGFYVIVKKPKIQPAEPMAQEHSAHNKTHEEKIDNIITNGRRLWDVSNGHSQKKRWVGNNAFLSKYALEQSASSSISDALSAVPGVVAFSDMRLGQAATGESEYVSIRSMDSQYTSTFINGVQIHGADPSTRSLSLKMLPPNAIGAVRILKTPSVEWGSENVGGALNMTSPTGYEFGENYFSISAGSTYSQLSDRRKTDSLAPLFNLELADVWGDNQKYGFYASAYYQQKYTAAESLEIGNYVSARENEQTQDLKATDIRFDFYHSLVEKTGGSFSFDYRTPAQNFFLKGNLNSYKSTGYDVQTKLERGVDSIYNAQGEFAPQGVMASGYFQTRDSEEKLGLIQLGGATRLIPKKLSINYQLSVSKSVDSRPDYVESSLNSARQDGNFDFDMRSLENINLTFDSPATENYLMNPQSIAVRKFQGSDIRSENTMQNAKFSLGYQPPEILDEINAGIDYNRSERDHYSRDLTGNRGGNYAIETNDAQVPDKENPQGPQGSELPGQNINFMNGIFNSFRVYDRAYFEDSMLSVAYQDLFTSSGVPNPGAYTLDDYNRYTIMGLEESTSLYFQGQKAINSLSVVAGVIYEKNQFSARHWDSTQTTHQFVKTANSDHYLLSNLNVSYQHSDSLIFRAAIRKAIARPPFSWLAESEDTAYDPTNDQITNISQANPNLKPERVINTDLSVEWYPDDESIIELALYNKEIKNQLYINQKTIVTKSAQEFTLSRPENGKQARLTGLDFHIQHRFDYLPAFWSGFGVDFGATLQRSEARNSLANKTTLMTKAPRRSYKLQVFHQSPHFLITANWNYTGEQLLTYTDTGLDKYLQPQRNLNLSMTYHLSPFSATLQIENLLNAPIFYKTMGQSKAYLGTQDDGGNGSFVNTGRFAKLYFTYTF